MPCHRCGRVLRGRWGQGTSPLEVELSGITIDVLALVRAHLEALDVAFFIRCCPCKAVGLYVSLNRRHATYASIQGTLSGIIPPYHHLAISPAQWDGGCVAHSNREGQRDGGSESVSLWYETLSGVDEVLPSPWLAEEADERRSH
jgi:hypothetical protein